MAAIRVGYGNNMKGAYLLAFSPSTYCRMCIFKMPGFSELLLGYCGYAQYNNKASDYARKLSRAKNGKECFKLPRILLELFGTCTNK